MNIIKKNILMFPFQYTFYSRAKSWMNKVSLLGMVLVPIFLNIGIMCGWKFSLLEFALGVVALFSVYEIGYIYNDTYALEREMNGTQRLDYEHLQDVKKKFPLYISVRVLYINLALFFLYILECRNIDWFVLGLGILYVIYSAHNYIRGRGNVLTFMLLYILKYNMLLILFAEGWKEIMAYSVFLFLEIIWERVIAYGNKRKYVFRKLKNFDSDGNRVRNSLIILVISGLLTMVNIFFITFLFGALYVLLYRVIGYMFAHLGTAQK